MNFLTWASCTSQQRKAALTRPVSGKSAELSAAVQEIVRSVKERGDDAVLELTKKHDRVALASLKVSASEIASARSSVSAQTLEDLKEAIRRVSLFHEAQLPRSIDLETSPGVRCERRHLPIDRVGLYVPGGTAPLPSTVIMLGVPAKIAGCRTRVLITPPQANGTINPHILVAADLLGITEIFKAGGAQAIAALAYGTQSIPKVDKIFGPGNSWVTEAKLQASQDPYGAVCDLPAGPSEVMVIADQSANPEFVASDLLSQAEHGEDSQVVLVSDSKPLIDQVLAEVQKQLAVLPRRAIAAKALEKSALVLVTSALQALEICNEYAPEHLILQLTDARKFAEGVRNAGSVFLGAWTPESAGDYASGTNHVLPTYGFARACGGVTTESFLKTITYQEISPRGLLELGPVVERLAQIEGLDAHARAVSLRLAEVKKKMKWLDSLARPEILSMRAYESARSLVDTSSELTFLDANESPVALDEKNPLNRYPEPQPKEMVRRFSEIYQIPELSFVIGRGSDEAIDLLVRAFCGAGDGILICPPTYGVYEIAARIQGAAVVRAPLKAVTGTFKDTFKDSFELDETSIARALAAAAPRIKIVFLCSPNNPTGTAFDPKALERICLSAKERAIVVVDEAYAEFSEEKTLLTKLADYPNLVVLRTLSKAWAMAGARCGIAAGSPEVIALLQKVRAPYPLSAPAIRAIMSGTSALAESAMQERVLVLNKAKKELVSALKGLSAVQKIHDSSANYVLVRFVDSGVSGAVMRAAKNAGIILRDRSSELSGCIRITVGTSAENQALINVLGSALKGVQS